MNGAFATFTMLKIVIGSNFNIGRYRIAFIQYVFNCRVITRAALKSDLNERAGCSGRLSDNEKVISALRVVRGHEGSLSSTVQISYVTAAIYQDSRVRARRKEE